MTTKTITVKKISVKALNELIKRGYVVVIQ
jgi:hypothetical protein